MNKGKIFIENELRSMQNLENNIEDNFTIINGHVLNGCVSLKMVQEKRVECLMAKNLDKFFDKRAEKICEKQSIETKRGEKDVDKMSIEKGNEKGLFEKMSEKGCEKAELEKNCDKVREKIVEKQSIEKNPEKQSVEKGCEKGKLEKNGDKVREKIVEKQSIEKNLEKQSVEKNQEGISKAVLELMKLLMEIINMTQGNKNQKKTDISNLFLFPQ